MATSPAPMAVSAAQPKAHSDCRPILRCQPPPSPEIPPQAVPASTASPCDGQAPDCPAPTSPSPSIVVISPVPLDPPSPKTTPSYLIGKPSPAPSPSPDSAGTPVPLGGGFADLPTPSPGPVSSTSDSSNRGGGLPLPLLLLGFLFLASAAGALIYAIAPRGDRFPEGLLDGPVGWGTPHASDHPELHLRG